MIFSNYIKLRLPHFQAYILLGKNIQCKNKGKRCRTHQHTPSYLYLHALLYVSMSLSHVRV